MTPKCVKAGNPNPDIAGIGIITAFAIQAGLSIVLSTWAYIIALRIIPDRRRQRAERAQHRDPPNSVVSARKGRILQLITIGNILAIISDVQSFNGISLLVAALVQHQQLDLYHYHIVYDTVNFTGVSYSASLLALWITPPPLESNQKTSSSALANKVIAGMRVLFAGIFSVFYLAFAILFGIALGTWNNEISGRCYVTHHIALSNASHPHVDRIYLGVTCFFMFALLIGCYLFGSPVADFLHDRAYKTRHARVAAAWTAFRKMIWPMRGLIILVALGQYPLHLYMVIAIRVSNKAFLEESGGDSENTWGFGQVVALVLLIPVLKECVFGFIEYKETQKGLLKEPGNEENPDVENK